MDFFLLSMSDKTPEEVAKEIIVALVVMGLMMIPMIIKANDYMEGKEVDRWSEDQLFPKNQFPKHYRYTAKNLIIAYVCLAARMIQSDTKDAGEKIQYMSKYFSKHFMHFDFRKTITQLYRSPIEVRSVTAWLNYRLPRREDRLQVMYFLSGLAMVDGRLLRKETELLRVIADLLELTPKEFDSIINMYQRYEEEKKNYNSAPTLSQKQRLIQISSKILGVSENASMDEIKKAYRAMVKLHHPDCFASEGEEQQKIAEQRFLEIQKAYETLEKWKF